MRGTLLGKKHEVEHGLAEGLAVRFTVRLRSVGGTKIRRSLGFTIPDMVCKDLNLKMGDTIKVHIQKVDQN